MPHLWAYPFYYGTFLSYATTNCPTQAFVMLWQRPILYTTVLSRLACHLRIPCWRLTHYCPLYVIKIVPAEEGIWKLPCHSSSAKTMSLYGTSMPMCQHKITKPFYNRQQVGIPIDSHKQIPGFHRISNGNSL